MSSEGVERIQILKASFGDQAAEFEQQLNDLAKTHFEVYQAKIKAQKPIFKARSESAKKIKQFWLTALRNCRQTAQFVDPVDEAALTHCTNVWIEHDEKDPRTFDFVMTFGSKNPSFKETELKRTFTVSPSSKPEDFVEPAAYDLEAPIYLEPCQAPTWTSAEHDLTKKAPRQDMTEAEEFDEFAGPGSFFYLFDKSSEGEDDLGMAETLLEWWAHATEYAANLVEVDSDDEGLSFDEDDEDDSDGDLNKEIDLQSDEDERPKKRSKKNGKK
ncbi:hypothetical protein OIV83_005488 [Microbotryomycetes sp. JL201]|nr:hypothetical protein OIV83_005488 [Microbotryomycetes sp. JL201]